jgi:hypothetical protein
MYLSVHESRVVAATRIENVRDEVLLSRKENPIGIRVRYSIRFSEDGKYDALFFLIPQGKPEGEFPLNMQTMTSSLDSVDPPLESGYSFKGGVLYTFTLDMIPNFVVENVSRTKVCVRSADPRWEEYAKSFKEFLGSPATEGKYQFRIVISTTGEFGVGHGDLHTIANGLTKNSYNPKVFYESALKEGAEECVAKSGRYF